MIFISYLLIQTNLAIIICKMHYLQLLLRNNDWLNLNGQLNETGIYQCVARINGIKAESNKITVQIYGKKIIHCIIMKCFNS